MREPFRGRAITTADIADVLARLEAQLAREMGDEGFDGFFRGLPAALPEPVMDMLAPDLAVERIQLVIMLCDGGGCLNLPGYDHGKASALCIEPSRMRVKAATCCMREGHA